MGEIAKRLEEHGTISIEGWDGLTEHDKLCFPAFVEGIENTWAWRPPSMHLGMTDGGDVTVVFGIALSESEFGPAWEFSLKDELENCRDWEDDEVKELAAALRALAEFVEKKEPLAAARGGLDGGERL